MDFILTIYRLDKRCKAGERKVGSYEYARPNEAAMDREVNELRNSGYPSSQYRIAYNPKYKTVKNLMSGKDVQIAYDTPIYCDPSSESYWSA